MNRPRQIVVLAFFFLVFASVSQAAELVVHSVAGEPLNATIIVDADPRGLSLAPPQAYTDRGLAFTSVHEDAKLGLTSSSDKARITLTTLSPVNEPAFHILVAGVGEADYVEFGVLLEVASAVPATLPRYKPTVNGEVPVAGGQQLGGALDAGTTPIDPKASQDSSSQARVSSLFVPTPTAATNAPPIPESSWDYGPVQRGDTLWRIATDAAIALGGDVNSAMRVIASANPQAFINGDMNRLRVGVTLSLGNLATPPIASAPLAAAPVASTVTTRGASLDASTMPVAPSSGTRTAPAQSTQTASAAPPGLQTQVAPVSSEAVSSVAAGLDELFSVGKKIAAAQTEIAQKIDSRRAKLEAVRARLAAQNEKIAALTAGVADLNAAIGTASLAPIAGRALTAVKPSSTLSTTVPAKVAPPQSESAAVTTSQAATSEPVEVEQQRPAPPARPVRPPSTMAQIQALAADYGLLVGGGLLLLWLIVVVVRTLKNVLSKRKARAGDAQRDEALKATVRAKTGAAAVTEGLLEVASFDDASTIDSPPTPTRETEVETQTASSLSGATVPAVGELLREVDVYIAYNQTETARQKLQGGLTQFPDNEELKSALQALDKEDSSPSNSADSGNVIPFPPRSTTTGAMYDLGIATDPGDEEDSLGNRS